MATTETVRDVARQLRENGFRVALDVDDSGTCEAFHDVDTDGDVSITKIYWALKKGEHVDAWIVRCHPDYFEREPQSYLNIQGENDE
jgi:hypothetical protein